MPEVVQKSDGRHARRRRIVSFMAASVFLFACPCACFPVEENFFDYSGYNVVLVSFDALQFAHTGCCGYAKNTTPTVDSFARSGFLFSNAVSSSSWTVPATMSWFTSLYPSEHRCINKYSVYSETEKILTDMRKLAPEVMTLTQVLKNNGYATGGFTGDAGVSGRFGFSLGFDAYFDEPKFGGFDRSVPEALSWIEKNRDKKLFIFLHGYDCHGQYDPPGGYTRRFLDVSYAGPLVGGKEEQGHFREEGLEKGSIALSGEDVRFWRGLYDEKINDADARFGKFIESYKQTGLFEKTIFIIASDHGTEFYEHKRFDHGFSLYDELIHVPLLIRLPGRDTAALIDDQVRGIDIMPTILDLVKARVPRKVKAQMKGTSLVPLMKGERMRLDAYSETDYRFITFKRSLRTSDGWKFICTLETGRRELYDLNTDPRELKDLAADEKKIAYELEQRLFAWLKTLGQDETYPKKLLEHVLRIQEY